MAVDKPTAEQLREWGKVLKNEGLTLSRGMGNLNYVGTSAIVERIEGEIRMDNGRVVPKEGVE
jgi:hypothetical protein